MSSPELNPYDVIPKNRAKSYRNSMVRALKLFGYSEEVWEAISNVELDDRSSIQDFKRKIDVPTLYRHFEIVDRLTKVLPKEFHPLLFGLSYFLIIRSEARNYKKIDVGANALVKQHKIELALLGNSNVLFKAMRRYTRELVEKRIVQPTKVVTAIDRVFYLLLDLFRARRKLKAELLEQAFSRAADNLETILQRKDYQLLKPSRQPTREELIAFYAYNKKSISPTHRRLLNPRDPGLIKQERLKVTALRWLEIPAFCRVCGGPFNRTESKIMPWAQHRCEVHPTDKVELNLNRKYCPRCGVAISRTNETDNQWKLQINCKSCTGESQKG